MIPHARPRLSGLAISVALSLAWVRPALPPNSPKPTTEAGQKLDYVIIEVNGQRLADQTLRLNLTPEGEATVEFERQFDTPGSHLVSVVLDNDPLPGDNRSDAVIVVAGSLPVLLVDGHKKLDPTRSETFFAKAALSAGGEDSSWIKPVVVTPADLNANGMFHETCDL